MSTFSRYILLPKFKRRRGVGVLARAGLLLAMVGIGCLPGCGRNGETDQAQDSQAASNPSQSVVERGPVRFSVEVEPARARLSDLPELTLTIETEPGVRIEPPPFGEALGEFLIRDFRETLPAVAIGRDVRRQVYTLEPTTTGTLRIDPITLHFTDERPEGDGQSHAVTSEPLTVEIESALEQEAPSLDALAGPTEPLALPRPVPWGILASIVAGLLLLASGSWILWRRRRQQGAQEVKLSPREQAVRDLERLWASDTARQDVKLFYVRLTGIVRTYIEQTTGIRAPEETTEEFLRDISTKSVFSRAEHDRLAKFLEAADLVKFAAVRPSFDDVKESYQRARSFVNAPTVLAAEVVS